MLQKPYLATAAVTHADGKVQRIDLYLVGTDDTNANLQAEFALMAHVQRLGRPVRNVAVLDVQAAG
jgi:hypothetical protein